MRGYALLWLKTWSDYAECIIQNTTGTYPGLWLNSFPGGVIPRAASPELLQHTSILTSSLAQFSLLVKWMESGLEMGI